MYELSEGINLYVGFVTWQIGQLKIAYKTMYSTYLERISRFSPPDIPGF